MSRAFGLDVTSFGRDTCISFFPWYGYSPCQKCEKCI
jgi:hypothetical protein